MFYSQICSFYSICFPWVSSSILIVWTTIIISIIYIYIYICIYCFLFSHCVRLFVIPWTVVRQVPCPSLSPGVFSDSCPLSWWCYLTISSSAYLSIEPLPRISTSNCLMVISTCTDQRTLGTSNLKHPKLMSSLIPPKFLPLHVLNQSLPSLDT